MGTNRVDGAYAVPPAQADDARPAAASRWAGWRRLSMSRMVYLFRVAVWGTCVGFAWGGPYAWIVAAAAVAILGGGAWAAQRVGYTAVNRYSLLVELAALSVAIRLGGGLASSAFLLYGGLGILLTVYGVFRWSLAGVAAMTVLYAWATGFPWSSGTFWFRVVLLALFAIGAAAVGESFVRRARRTRDAERRLEQLEGLRLIQEGLLREEPLEVILDKLVSQAVSMVGAQSGYIVGPGRGDRLRVLGAAGGLETGEVLAWEAGEVSVHMEALRTNHRVVLRGEEAMAEAVPQAARWGWRALAVLPIPANGQGSALLGLGFQDPARLDGDNLRILDSLAALAGGQMRYDAERTAARKRGRLLATLDRVGRLVNANLRMEHLLPVLHQAVAGEIQTDSFFVLLVTPGDLTHGYMAYLYDDGKGYPPTTVTLTPHSPTVEVLTSGEPRLWNEAPEGASTIGSDRDVTSMMVAPLSRESRVLGVISAQSYSGRFDDDHLEFLSAIANQAAIAIENAQLYQRAEEVAMTDNMTGLGNARRLAAVGDETLREARERGRPLSVLLIDSDSLKAVNDRYGHQAGDAHLQHLAATIRACIRAGDQAFRYAGDEFVVVLVDTPATQAARVAERIRDEVAAGFEWQGRHISGISISVGVTEFRPDQQADAALTMEALFSRADRLMYQAKVGGKNRVAVGV